MTINEFYRINKKEISRKIKEALAEDKVNKDVTTGLLLNGNAGNEMLEAVLLCKQDCIIAGLDVFKQTYRIVDPSVKFTEFKKEGSLVKKGSRILKVTASRSTLLRGERTALNFLQRMSGIATLTSSFVKQLKYKEAKILHTRKTTPGFRLFEAAAVKTGGGEFHRLSLNSAVMIKDNHIEALGGIENTMDSLLRKKISFKLKQKFEIEVKTLKELDTVLKYGNGIVKVVMLDNFKSSQLKTAVKLLKAEGYKIELSGGINAANFGKIQQKGVDYYSIGVLTHSYSSVDFSLEFC